MMLEEAHLLNAQAQTEAGAVEADSNDIVSPEQQGSNRKRRILLDGGSSVRSPISSGKESARCCGPDLDTCRPLTSRAMVADQTMNVDFEADVLTTNSTWVERSILDIQPPSEISGFESTAGKAGFLGIKSEDVHAVAPSEVLDTLSLSSWDPVKSEHQHTELKAETWMREGSPAHSVVQDCQVIPLPEKVTIQADLSVQPGIHEKCILEDREIEEPSCTTSSRMSYQITDENRLLDVSPGDIVVAINAGGCLLSSETYGIEFSEDQYFSGGDVLRTEESICQTKEPSLYQTARYGNVSYAIPNLLRGDYVVNLHFAEIIFTSGPPGMRVFDISIQGHKVVSDLDVYLLAGSNKALILSVQTTVSNGVLALSFEGVNGSPTICAISVLKAPLGTNDLLEEVSSSVSYKLWDDKAEDPSHGLRHLERTNQLNGEDARRQQRRAKAKQCVKDYEAKLEELKRECHEAWMSLEQSQTENESLRSELTSKTFSIDTLANVVEAQQDELKELKEKTESDEQKWKNTLYGVIREAQMLREMHSALSRDAKNWVASFPEVSGIVVPLQKLAEEHELLKTKYLEESQERRQLYNKVIELKGNIRVFCRCRPLGVTERAVGSSSVVEFDKGSAKDDELTVRTGTSGKKTFKFDRVFTPQDGQEEVFADTAPVVVSVLDGYNVCIFAYGQTGTGKTFTMLGCPDNRGVNYRTLEELFRVASERKGQFVYEISVSVMEVYNEQIRDLLTAPHLQGQGARKLEIKQVSEGVHHVPGLIEAQVHSMPEVWEVLQSGSHARAVGSTNCNEHSSRSHFILCVMVKGDNLLTGECTRSKLWLVDLAGSERVTKSDVQGDRLKEAQNINKSLASLGDVIYALTSKSSHIPYRNSKLTHLLQDSLGGDSKTLMFVQISPNEADLGETLSSLNFASRVRGIELGPAKKQLDSGEMLKYKQQAEKAKQELKKLEESLRGAETKLKMKEQLCQALTDKVRDRDRSITELELQVASEKKLRIEVLNSQQLSMDGHPEGSGDAGDCPLGGPGISEAQHVTRRPLLERALLAYDLRQSDSMENVLKCSTDSSGFRNENADPELRVMDKLKLHPQRFTSPTPQKLLPRRTGRASFAGVPRRTSLLPSSFVVKASGQMGAYEDLPLPLPTTLRLSNEATPSILRPPPGTASRVMRPSLRRSTMQFGGCMSDAPQRKDLNRQGEARRARDSTSHRPSLSSGVDRKKPTSTLRVSLTKPLRTVAGSGAQRVLSAARPSRTGLKPPVASHRWNK